MGVEVDLFIPSFPQLQEVFQLTPFMVELTLGVNLAANCIACLFAGMLGDRYGRKPIIMYGLGIFIVGSLLCVFAQAYWYLLLGRFLQGLGIAAPAVLSYLVIADAYPIEEQQSKMGTINGTITLAMAFAPVIGSYINLWFDWRGNFAALLGLSLICFILGWRLLPKGVENLEVSLSLKSYKPVILSKKAMTYNFTIAAFCQPFWVFIGMAPLLYMGAMGVELKAFGFYQGAMAGVFSILSLSSGFFLKRFGSIRCFSSGLVLLVLFVILDVGLLISGVHDPLLITIVCMIQAAGFIWPINMFWPISLEAVEGAKARMSALIVGTRMLLTAISIQIVSHFYHDEFFPIGIAMMVFVFIGLIGVYILFKYYGVLSYFKKQSLIQSAEETHEAPLH